jgi:SNF2 family DNA or RNA helicase
MAKTIIQVKCPSCGKLAKERARYRFGEEWCVDLECGHSIISDALDSKLADSIDIVSKDGRRPFPYQIEGCKFLEDADCNALLLDDQGLGKTVQECMILKRNPKLLPALIVVKSGLRAQWFAEIYRWTGLVAQIITSSKEQPYFDAFDVVIVSIDTLRLLRPDIKVVSDWDKIVAESAGKKVKELKPLWSDETIGRFKHIAVDEIQKVKNPNSARTKALRKIIALANGGQKARVVGLSGTPIDKHAGEFFPALNMIRPELFPQHATYILSHCKVNPETGKIGGLKNPERFRELTKDFILRRLRKDVLPDLPKIFRQFQLAELEGSELDSYIRVVKEFQEFMEDPTPKIPTDILGYMARMRHITGIAKVPTAVDWCQSFLEECDRPLVVFLHHQQAAAELIIRLTKIMTEEGINDEKIAAPLYLKGGMTLTDRVEVEQAFREGKSRILVASTLASCEGLNLQFCSDCLFLERQWNPKWEEQAETRFPRPRPDDPWPADAKINAVYLIAAGTIDDFLTEIVEVKRRNVDMTIDGTDYEWNESSLQMELAQALATKGLKKWKLAA